MTEELSGIELRQAVAAALGLVIHPTAIAVGGGHYYCTHQGCTGDLKDSLSHPHPKVPAYDYDLNAVFRDVVPFAKSLGYRLALYDLDLYDHGPMWRARFWPKSGRPLDAGQHASLAIAICRAFMALRTDMEEQRP